MKLLVDRKWKKPDYCIGILYVNGVRFSETLEDKDRGLSSTMSDLDIKLRKVYGKTAVPTGKYNVRMDVVSPTFSTKSWYINNCNGGRMPKLENVKGFSGILIHPGNTAKDSFGCILVGRNTVVGQVTHSKETFQKLYNLMLEAHKKREKIEITIK